MLEIVKFIHEHEDWEILLSNAPYNLKISWDDGFVLFKYNQINSDFNEPICLEARGLILDSLDNFKVVRMAFKKFFNLGEGFAAQLDWDATIASEKVDGSLMTLWYAHGKWHLSTNGTIDAYKAKIANSLKYKTFGELFNAAAINSNLKIEELNPHYNYTFELVSPFNQIVLSYPAPALYHILTRDMNTLEEINVDIGVQKPQTYNLNSKTDYENLVAQMGDGHEGIVVKDCNGNRVKIKTKLYFELHRLHNNGNLNLERIIELIRENDYEELLAYYPEYTDYVIGIKEQVENAEKIIVQIKEQTARFKEIYQVNETNQRQLKGCFAQLYKRSEYSALYFLAYDNKIDSVLETMNTKKFINLFNLKLKE